MWKFITLLPINDVELLPAMPRSCGAPTINCAQCLKKNAPLNRKYCAIEKKVVPPIMKIARI